MNECKGKKSIIEILKWINDMQACNDDNDLDDYVHYSRSRSRNRQDKTESYFYPPVHKRTTFQVSLKLVLNTN